MKIHGLILAETGAFILATLAVTADLFSVIPIIAAEDRKYIYIATYLLICIIFLIYALTKEFRKKELIKTVSHHIHEINHELRNIYYEMFENKSKLQTTEIINQYAIRASEVVAMNISTIIFEYTKKRTSVVVKTFLDEESRKMRSIPHRGENYSNAFDNIKLHSVFKAINGKKIDIIKKDCCMSDNDIYVAAMNYIFSENRFVSSDTAEFMETYKKYHAKYPKNENRPEWYHEDKSFIIVGISDERHLWNIGMPAGINSQILGFIKIAFNDNKVLEKLNVADGSTLLALGISDTLYKCFERIQYYYNMAPQKGEIQ